MACRRAASSSFSIAGKRLWPAGTPVRVPVGLRRARATVALAPMTVGRPCAAARGMSFSFPGPRKLGDITNLPLLEQEKSEDVADIWAAYHDERMDSLGTVLPGDTLVDVQRRAKKCPMFILPVWRDAGHFMVLSQYQDTCFLLTYLEDFKTNPGGAQPYATISMYGDLVESKGLGLVRADITPNLSKKEVDRLVRLLIRFYSPHAHHHVEAFNLRPQEFDLEKLLQETPRD